jgi:phenylalanyl-tRNA synthetase alpha chain
MRDKLAAIETAVRTQLQTITALSELEALRLQTLGKKGALTQLLQGLGALPAADRPAAGQAVNQTRRLVEELLEQSKHKLQAEQLEKRLATEAIDVTLPGKRRPFGHRHPMTLVTDELKDLFLGMGYEIAEGPEVETDYYNFEALNIPEGHPAKDEQDTFYLEGGAFLLRSQTSSVQIRTMEKKKPPIKIVAPGRVFRADQVDATHSPVFHQLEGLVVDRGVSMGDLKGTLSLFARALFGEATRVRFRPHHFQFTEPSAEMDISCFVCGGSGCRVCKESGWIELLGCGMVHPYVLSKCGVDPQVFSGFAFGVGLERIAMARFGITDMRLLYENDVKFLRQF